MALTHVCMWSEHSWKRITSQEAARMFPDGASAHSGLFMCELCGQYVSLTNGSVQSRHFRHSAKEQNKNCDDRSGNYGYSHYFQAEAHGLPIRINIINRYNFELELGFVPIPEGMVAGENNILIKSITAINYEYVYLTSRLVKDGITYLSIGDEPKEKYQITVDPMVAEITTYWPNIIEGISTGGVFFDGRSRKKLPYDADVMVEHKYFLLIRGSLCGVPSSISVDELCSSTKRMITWKVYSIVAHEFSESVAKFFLTYHCRLTDEPVKMYPIWPPHVNLPYVVYHQARELFIYFKGNVEPQIAPIGSIRKIPYNEPRLLLISASDRQQLLSVGRTGVLQYTYFWHKELNYKGVLPQVEVYDGAGRKIEGGSKKDLPAQKMISIKPEVDGFVEIEKDGAIIEKYDLKSGSNKLDVCGIEFGTTVTVFQGCDVVWRAEYIYECPEKADFTEKILLKRLMKCKGRYIYIDHTFGVAAIKYKNYPTILNWIYKAIKQGRISEEAYKIIKLGIL